MPVLAASRWLEGAGVQRATSKHDVSFFLHLKEKDPKGALGQACFFKSRWKKCSLSWCQYWALFAHDGNGDMVNHHELQESRHHSGGFAQLTLRWLMKFQNKKG
jgi:hypothetical protein